MTDQSETRLVPMTKEQAKRLRVAAEDFYAGYRIDADLRSLVTAYEDAHPASDLALAVEALSWALDVLEVSLKRLDTIEPEPYSQKHYDLRRRGLEKARTALANLNPDKETTP